MIKKFFILVFISLAVIAAAVYFWARQPITDTNSPPIEFSIQPGSGVKAATRQIVRAGVPTQPLLLEFLARASGKSTKIKAGAYELKPGTTPMRLLDQMVRGEFAQEMLVIIEGWTFKQMRQAVANHKGIRQDAAKMSDQELLAKIGSDFKKAEGLFFPDTYLFAKGSSDLQIYRQAHSLLLKRLNEEWAKRDSTLPYRTPYEALIMASIVEKETGKESERGLIAGVFVNRLRLGMLLQTDPTVIYGMGEQYQGNIRKRDLLTDTPYNTYTRAGLPPTPIALPGAAALNAALRPAQTDALYFVSRGDGSSYFSSSLAEHNQAVNKYQRNQK